METFKIIIIIIFLIIIFIISLIIILKSKSYNAAPSHINIPDPNINAWSNVIEGPNNLKNTCQLYQFPSSIIDGFYFPGMLNTSTEIIDNKQGSTSLPTCLDSDQIALEQVSHTCNNLYKGSNPNFGSSCYLKSGGTTGPNGEEIFYQTCNNIKRCPGSLNLLSLSYQVPNNNNINCLEKNGNMETCDPSNSNQIFRITRVEVGQDPNNLVPGKSQTGPLAQIYHRESNTCLDVNFDKTIDYNIYYYYFNDENCISSIGDPNLSKQHGPSLEFVSCGNKKNSNGLSSGYNWFLLDSIFYCPKKVGCVPGDFVNIPSQLIYVKNLDFTNYPINGNYFGFEGNNAIIAWLEDQNPMVVIFGAGSETSSDSNQKPSLTDFISTKEDVENNYCFNLATKSQFLNLNIYNKIVDLPICISENQKNCFGF